MIYDINDEYVEVKVEQPVTDNKWELVSASSEVLLPSRWRLLREYVLLGRRVKYTISAWVNHSHGISGLKIYVTYPKGN